MIACIVPKISDVFSFGQGFVVPLRLRIEVISNALLLCKIYIFANF